MRGQLVIPPCEEDRLPGGSQALPQGSIGQHQALSHTLLEGGRELGYWPPGGSDRTVSQHLPESPANGCEQAFQASA